MIRHTHGKTASSSNPKTFSVYRLAGNVACPVVALEAYVDGALRMGIDVRNGFLFRKMGEKKMCSY